MILLSDTKVVKNKNIEKVMRMAMELCRKDPKELTREFWEEKAVEILKNNIKILEMQD